MEIHGLGPTYDIPVGPNTTTTRQKEVAPVESPVKTSQPRQGTDKSLSELQHISVLFDRRLEYAMNRDINRVVVKIIDVKTDKVIRELPPKQIQELYRSIREAVGLLFDHKT